MQVVLSNNRNYYESESFNGRRDDKRLKTGNFKYFYIASFFSIILLTKPSYCAKIRLSLRKTCVLRNDKRSIYGK